MTGLSAAEAAGALGVTLIVMALAIVATVIAVTRYVR